jgi:hypothetical protein
VRSLECKVPGHAAGNGAQEFPGQGEKPWRPPSCAGWKGWMRPSQKETAAARRLAPLAGVAAETARAGKASSRGATSPDDTRLHLAVGSGGASLPWRSPEEGGFADRSAAPFWANRIAGGTAGRSASAPGAFDVGP